MKMRLGFLGMIEEMKKYIKEGSLNSRETDRAFRLRDEMLAIERSKIKFNKKEECYEDIFIFNCCIMGIYRIYW